MIWEIDPAHSHASFSIRVMFVSTTKGHFNALHGHLYIDEQNPANSWVDARVDAASIDTGLKRRDDHLRSADFFEVEKYPTITFKSMNVEHIGSQGYKVTGNLTMHGVTNPITFDVAYSGHESTMRGVRATLTAKAKIRRNDFGVGHSVPVQIAAGSLVTIDIALAVVQKSEEVQETMAIAE